MTLLSVYNLGKSFTYYNLEWKRFANWFGFRNKPTKEDWVLRNINFQVESGDSIGIIGLNGAGKSTLLKIITGTLQPSEGQKELNGRIGAILELGMGFNPELTGRENAFHTGSLMGFEYKKIEQVIPEIEAFADIGKYFDEPIRVYSSGMQMRVSFSVATAFQPDILIIDEALAVGDAHFQQKCFHRIQKFQKEGGTLLFVSHDPGVIKTLCNRALLLDKGRLIKNGTPKEVMDLYQSLVSKYGDMGEKDLLIYENTQLHDINRNVSIITTNNDAELIDFKLYNSNFEVLVYAESESDIIVRYKIKLKKYLDRPAFGLIIRDKIGNSMFECSTYSMGVEVKPILKEKEVTVDFNLNLNLKAGQYTFSVGLSNRGFSRSEFEEHILLVHDVQQIQVIEAQNSIFYGGIFNMKPTVSINF
jgi:lipopolysaccharide transport system ATP-binding protein